MPNPYTRRLVSGVELISYRRLDQIDSGYDAKHDDAHVNGELLNAALSYATIEGLLKDGAPVSRSVPPIGWPFEEQAWKPSNDPVKNLVQAGAYLAAEIDRLNRLDQDEHALYIFDKDGTLIGDFGSRPANTPDEQVPMPNVVGTIAQLRNCGHKCYIASNQGGVSWGYITYEDAYYLLKDACEKCGIDNTHFMFCPFDERGKYAPVYEKFSYLRKPAPGMLHDIMRANPSYHRVIMVGDRDSDKDAATAAGIEFEWAQEFFGWK